MEDFNALLRDEQVALMRGSSSPSEPLRAVHFADAATIGGRIKAHAYANTRRWLAA